MTRMVKFGSIAIIVFVVCMAANSFASTVHFSAPALHVSTAPAAAFLLEPLTGDRKPNTGCDKWDRREKCSKVPEGGSAMLYLALAGFVCLGAAVIHYRRRAANAVS